MGRVAAGARHHPPYNPHTGKLASSTDPATWGTRQQAEGLEDKAGVGIMLGPVHGWLCLCSIDLDTCIDGEIAPWAQEVIDRFDTYAEVSPNGKGVKLFFFREARAKLEGKGRKQFRREGGKHPAAIEIYFEGATSP